jgi:periplasmic protein TonB
MQPMNTLALPDATQVLFESARRQGRWWQSPGTIASALAHLAAIAVLIVLSTKPPAPEPVERTIQLVLAPPEVPKPLQPPPVVPAPQPKTLVPPRPAPVQHAAPRPRTVAAKPEQAEVAAPAAPQPTPAPVAEAPAPAPAPPPAPRPSVINTEGIPSDYVTQVFNKINHYAGGSYPRIARLRHLEGRIGYTLTLAPDGSLIKYELQGSGEQVLDDAAEQAIKAAAPFPKLPELGASSYRLSGAIVYRFEG